MMDDRKIREMADGISDEVIRLRRQFHRFPEKSWEEKKTQEMILAYLAECGIEAKPVCETGVIAEIRGGKAGEDAKVLGIRADIDALPVTEETGVPFASENPGVMHACGHDTHISIALVTAKLLHEIRDELPLTVRVFFQPSEEDTRRMGAEKMKLLPEIASCDRIVALHIWSTIPAGCAAVDAGPVMAATNTFTIHIKGRGGHGACPEETKDPIFAASQLISSLQQIVSRKTSPFSPTVVTVTSVHAGTTWNVIPGEAEILGTTRTHDAKVQEILPEMMREICEGTGRATGTEITLEYYCGPRVLINDAECAALGQKAAAAVFGKENVVPWCLMVGEDFAQYDNPKCMMFLGGGLEDESMRYPQHSPRYCIDESVLCRGAEYFVRYALLYGEEG